MLDFLRRKDKRKPQDAPAAAAAAAAAAALASAHTPPATAAAAAASSSSAAATATAAAVAARKAAHEKPAVVLRDRNAAALRRQNTQHRTAATAKNDRARPRAGDKENAAAKDAAEPVEIPPNRRWGKRQQVTTSATPAGGGGASAQDKKRKNRRQKKFKHSPAVLAKSVTSDRRRSVKVASSPIAQPAPAALKKRGSKGAQEKEGVAGSALEKGAEVVRKQATAARTSASRGAVESHAEHQRKPSREVPTWPHVDLAEVLARGEVAAADIPVRRIAAAAVRDDATRLKMVLEGVAQSLITLVRVESATTDMRRLATFAIAELAVLEACEDELVAAGTVPALVMLISLAKTLDRSTLGSACRGLRNLLGGKETTAVQAAKYGCVEPLLSIIDGRSNRADEPEVVVEAAAALSNLANQGVRFQRYVIKHGGLDSLTTLGMNTENEEAMFHVVNVLAEFAREVRWHTLIVSANGLRTAFRALRLARDPEVVAEASRLVGNMAVTHKARSAVREAGGLVALIEKLSRCKTFSEVVPVFDIVRALANVCDDGRAASDVLSQRDGAAALLRVYTATDATEKLIKTAFRALQILAHGSATRRAKVLYAVGIQVKQASLAGLSVKRLYDLRQAILEDIETGDRNGGPAMPESLERLSRASVRLINSGVVNHGKANPQYSRAQVINAGRSGPSPTANGQRINESHRPGTGRTPLHGEHLARKAHLDAQKFRSTGRVVSVTRNCRPKQQPAGMKQLAEGRAANDAEDYYGLPRGNEEALASDADLRARMLAKEADGDMVQDFFEIGQVLGKGGYGSVFMAKDVRTGDIVAIKRFHNNGALVDKKAVKEQNIWKGLHHPNVVEFKGSFVGDNGSLNLVVEYVDGLSLAEHLSQYSAFPETLVAEIARQVLSGLQYLHANGVTHRDLKPANILVDNSAAVKICDFGVSRSENVQTINPGQQHMVGTPWYIAPEMVEYRPYTTSVDVWSLGCTVLELATGRRPYHELSAMQVLFRMVEDRQPPIPAHLSAEATDFLRACWIWDPQERPSAAGLLRHPFILKARKFSGSSKQSSLTSTPDNLEL